MAEVKKKIQLNVRIQEYLYRALKVTAMNEKISATEVIERHLKRLNFILLKKDKERYERNRHKYKFEDQLESADSE